MAPVPTDAQSIIAQALKEWGLTDLTTLAWQLLTGGATGEQVVYQLRQTPQHKIRFAGNDARTKAGLPPLSESEYLSYEQQARELMRSYGLPSGFYDQPSDFAGFIGKDVSVSELQSRMQIARDLVNSEPAETRAAWQRLYGLTAGDATAAFLDPDKALPLLQRQLAASEAAGAGSRVGFTLDQTEAERVAMLTGSAQQAAQGLGDLAKQQELLGNLPGEAGPALGLPGGLEAEFNPGSPQAQALSRRQKARQAQFSGSGRFTTTQQGAGLGPAGGA